MIFDKGDEVIGLKEICNRTAPFCEPRCGHWSLLATSSLDSSIALRSSQKNSNTRADSTSSLERRCHSSGQLTHNSYVRCCGEVRWHCAWRSPYGMSCVSHSGGDSLGIAENTCSRRSDDETGLALIDIEVA